MIDYISGFLPCKHDPSKLISGMVMSFDPLGNQEWVCNKKLSVVHGDIRHLEMHHTQEHL